MQKVRSVSSHILIFSFSKSLFESPYFVNVHSYRVWSLAPWLSAWSPPRPRLSSSLPKPSWPSAPTASCLATVPAPSSPPSPSPPSPSAVRPLARRYCWRLILLRGFQMRERKALNASKKWSYLSVTKLKHKSANKIVFLHIGKFLASSLYVFCLSVFPWSEL